MKTVITKEQMDQLDQLAPPEWATSPPTLPAWAVHLLMEYPKTTRYGLLTYAFALGVAAERHGWDISPLKAKETP